METNRACIEETFSTYEESIPGLLNRLGASAVFRGQKRILLKPNLVNASPFPVTTSPDFCKIIIQTIQSSSDAEIIIGEGCGDADLETDEIFSILGYDRLAANLGVSLLDLNHAPLTQVHHKNNRLFPTMHLPKIAFESFIVSLPVLKAHSLSRITGTLKNMMGFAPPEHYSGGGYWKKASFHAKMQQSILELNRCISPDLTIMDATVGLCHFHLGGPECSPPVNRIIGGFDPVAVDRKAAELLGLDWKKIGHIATASPALHTVRAS